MRKTDSLRGLGRNLRGLFTFAVIGPAILVFIIHGILIKAFTPYPILRRRRLLNNVRRYCRFALAVMRVDYRAEAGRFSPGNQLLVCNHLSYLDMMILAAIRPSVFVTSVDMGQVFFLGTMAEIAGSVFVERRNRERLEHDVWQLEEVLSQGFDVTLFPEGTSGNGEGVLPFKRGLLTAALNLRTPVRPLTLRYLEIDGEIFSPANRDVVCWYGKASFFPHFFRLLSSRSVKASVTVNEPVVIEESATKYSLSDQLHRIISDQYHQRRLCGVPDSPLREWSR